MRNDSMSFIPNSALRLPHSSVSNSASCEASANPLRVHSLDKLAKGLTSATSMNRDD